MSRPTALYTCNAGHAITAASHDGGRLTGGFFDLTDAPCPACWNRTKLEPLKAWERPTLDRTQEPRKGFRLEIRYPGDVLTYACALAPEDPREAEQFPQVGQRLDGGGRIVAVYLVNDQNTVPARLKA